MNYNLQRITVDHFTSITFWRRTKLNFSLLKFLNLARDFQCQYWRSLNRAAPANVNPYWTQSQKPQLCSEKKHPKVFLRKRCMTFYLRRENKGKSAIPFVTALDFFCFFISCNQPPKHPKNNVDCFLRNVLYCIVFKSIII